MKSKRRCIGSISLILLLGACGPGAPDEGVATPEEENEEHELHLEGDQLREWGVTIGAVGRTTIAAELTLPGSMALNQNRTAKVAPLVSGQISAVRVDLGTRVVAGQILATMNSPEFTRAQTQFLQAFAQAELSRKDFERAQVLRESRAIEEREFLRREALYEQQLAERRAAEVFLHSLGVGEDHMRELEGAVDLSIPPLDHQAVDPPLNLKTPVGGVVIERNAILGDHAEAGQTLFVVSDLSSLWAHLDAYEDKMASLTRDGEAVIRTPQYPGRDFPGRITVVADEVDEQLRTVEVRVEVPNPDGLLKPNMYIQGLIRIQGEEERLVVPPDAVELLEDHHVVFVRMPPEPGEDHTLIRAVDVELGETLSVGRVIQSGLDGSEAIVTQGAFNLKAELTKGAGGHAHVH